MSNEPNNADGKHIDSRTQNPSPADKVPAEPHEDQIFELSSLDELQFDEHFGDLGSPQEEGLGLDAPLDPPDVSLPPLSETVSFDAPLPKDAPSSLTLGIALEDLPSLGDFSGTSALSGSLPLAESASDSGSIPLADPASSDKLPHSTLESGPSLLSGPGGTPGSSVVLGSAFDDPGAVGNLEPVAPVQPVSGWLASESDIHSRRENTVPLEKPLGVHQADLFEAPPMVESSDIFSSGPVPTASAADLSDVISATAHVPEAQPGSDNSGRPSEIAITFNQPPGGSTIHQEGGSADLPIADELFDDAIPAALPVNDDKTPRYPIPRPDLRDQADYGSTPIATPDASSILSDLSDPGDITIDESSSVRLEAPGVERTLGQRHEEGTEFDLTITDDPMLPELAAAAGESSSDEPVSWEQQTGSDLFSQERTSPEINPDDSGRVAPVDPHLKSDEPSLASSPSSIFSANKVLGKPGTPGSDSVRIGRPPLEEDAAVEFSDHPTADPEASSANLAAPPISPKKSAGKVDLGSVPASKQEEQDSGRVDWAAAGIPEEHEATIGFPKAMIGGPLSGILKRGASLEDSDESTIARAEPATKKATGKAAKQPAETPEGTDPSVEIDWMAGSSSEEPAVQPEVYEAEPAKKEKGKDKKEGMRDKKKVLAARDRAAEPVGGRRSASGWIGGTLVGMVVAGGACAGAYFSGLVPNAKPGPVAAAVNNPGPGPSGAGHTREAQVPLTVADATAAIHAGDPGKALRVLDAVKAAAPEQLNPVARGAIGQARLFARVQSLAKSDAIAFAPDDAELQQARADLEALIHDEHAVKTPEGEKAAVKAMIHLGVAYELANDRDKAKQIYEEGAKKFPRYATAFQSALHRLSSTGSAGDGHSQRLAPRDAEPLLLTVVLMQADAPAGEDEAGVYFWKAVNLAGQGKYGEAVDDIKRAKTIHQKQAKALAGRGLNPLSDPLEQIFPRCCDDLKAYWELKSALYANPTVAASIKKDGLEKALNELAAAQDKAMEAVKLMAELKDAGDKLAKAQKDLKEAQEQYIALDKKRLDQETAAKKEIASAQENAVKAEDARKEAETVVNSLAKELQSGKFLAEKYDAPTLLAAQKIAVERASGPNLATLLPPGMMAVAGGALSSAHLTDLADRLTKSEAAAKAASEKLTSETQRLTSDHDAAVNKLKDAHAAEVKKLADAYTAEAKKLQADQVAEAKKIADKFASEMKKLTDDNATAIKTLKAEHEAKVVALQNEVAREKAAGEAALERLRVDIRNAVSPSQTLDLWLPQLAELRRPADADPALATTTKVLAASAPDSEEAAKANTVAGLALLLKGQFPEAKSRFERARSSPAYTKAAGKEWVKIADVGLESVSDPLAAYRLPIEKPKREPKLAARLLDEGMSAFREGRYSAAQPRLEASVAANPTDPLAWYFLGASRWALGAKEQAKADFQQGAVWEKQSLLPAREISDQLQSIQGPVRDALTAARPY
jgi:hypothetical protein